VLDKKKCSINRLHNLGENVLRNIDMADVTKLDLIKVIANT
jgi:hypothetical protein